MKLLSLIIPAYNVESYIYFLIQSIIENVNCSLSSFEIVVVNDGSKDITLEEIKRAKRDFSDFDITYISQNNQGVSAARNVGLSLAKGKFVWFIDGDDAIAKVSLCSIMHIIEQYKGNSLGERGIVQKVVDVPEASGRGEIDFFKQRRVNALARRVFLQRGLPLNRAVFCGNRH